MARIVVVSQSEDSRSKLVRLLASSGLQVFRSCSSGSELRRALSESEDCVVVMIGFTPDCKPDELMWDYKDSIQILLIAKQAVLENIADAAAPADRGKQGFGGPGQGHPDETERID